VLKTIACGYLRKEHIGKKVTLSGWVHKRRDHGGLIFVDLRDREGIVQVVFNPDSSIDAHKIALELRNEWVLRVDGEVRSRPAGTENPNLMTGDVEVLISHGEVLNPSKPPPVYVSEEIESDELLRLRYRYLDLRRPKMRDNLILRHRVVKFIRDFLDNLGFLDIETPILLKSTPEGARDYLVPSRLQKGHFYALPQSPQQLKQLLMVAGLERYFQIARCFRDEDLRADRQPEFTQLDLEMSFVDEDDVLSLIDDLYTALVSTITPEKQIPTKPFPRIAYHDAMTIYGTDKPDLRFGLQMADLSDIAEETDFVVFRNAITSGGIVKGFAAPDCSEYSRSQVEELTEFVKTRGALGLVTLGVEADPDPNATMYSIKSAAGRHIGLDKMNKMAQRLGAKPGDMVFIIAGNEKVTNLALSQLRHELGSRLALADPSVLSFAFIVDFPLFEWDSRENRWNSVHHPFSAPKEDQWKLVTTSPGDAISKCYDLVCNGNELASGSIRIHKRELQEKILRVLGYGDAEMEDQFGHLLEALEYGAPPHGGIASGIERLVMLLSANAKTIRDVMAFPKTQSGADPLFGAPAPARPEQLIELHLKTLD
jgi:aspartyl-tRNA synthetase